MAKKRRGYSITSDTYSVGGGSGGGSNMAFWKGTSAGGAIKANMLKDKQEITAMSDINAAGPTVGFSYDHSFDYAKPALNAVLVGTLPAGLSSSINSDNASGDDIGTVQVSGTPTAAAGDYKWSYTITDPHDDSVFTVKFKYTIAPAGTSPAYSSTTLPSKFIRNMVGAQYVTVAPTTSYAGATHSLANVVNPHTGYTLKLDATGRVYIDNTPNTVLSAATVSFDIVTNLGEFGTSTQSFSGSVSTGDPYGSRYFGPGNAYTQYNYADHRSHSNAAYVDGSAFHRTNCNSGALRHITNQGRSSTPYTGSYQPTDSLGLYYTQAGAAGINNSTTTSYAATNYQNYFVSSTNGAGMVYKWLAPAGVTQFAVVAIGAGGPGCYNWNNMGGGGGGLAYLNAITCTPGEEFWVQIGTPRFSVSSNSQWYSGDSFLMRASNSEYLVVGWGGGHYSGRAQPPQGWIGAARSSSASAPTGCTHAQNAQNNTQADPGAASYQNGYGSGGAYYAGWSTSYGHGGGAAGYRGNGTGGSNTGSSNTSGAARNGENYSSTWGGSGGGGVGLDGNGRGASDFGYSYGTADSQPSATAYQSIGSHGHYYGGGGGSGGTRGDWGENQFTGRGHFEGTNYAASGGMHGGGGGGSATSTQAGGRGGNGGVRIIWGVVGGTQRAFPNTYTTENPAITAQS